MRKNLRVKLGDMVTLTKIDDLPNCEQIHVLPFSDSIEGVTGNLFDGYIKGYFQNNFRPVKQGDTFIVHGNFKSIEFKIVECKPELSIVVDETKIFHEGEPVDREDEEKLDEIG